MNTIKLEKAGFITLHFKHNNDIFYSYYRNTHKRQCPENVLYDVKVFDENYKPSKIIGAKGVNGRKTEKNFWIQVSPNTNSISLSILKDKEVQSESWIFGKKIVKLKKRIRKLEKAEGSTPSWQKAFKNVESKLIETAEKDKTSPKIQIFSPSNNQKVDSYNLFVRGKVTDNEGFMNLIVNRTKSSVKIDGTFVSKVKLDYG